MPDFEMVFRSSKEYVASKQSPQDLAEVRAYHRGLDVTRKQMAAILAAMALLWLLVWLLIFFLLTNSKIPL